MQAAANPQISGCLRCTPYEHPKRLPPDFQLRKGIEDDMRHHYVEIGTLILEERAEGEPVSFLGAATSVESRLLGSEDSLACQNSTAI